jgi:microcystin-dependent protein
MARTQFYHVVTRKDPATGDVEPLEDCLATAFNVDETGTETTEATIFLGRTGLSAASGDSNANGVISFWLDDGDYNVYVTDTHGPARFSDYSVGVSSINGATNHIAIETLLAEVASLSAGLTAFSAFIDPFLFKTADIKLCAVTYVPTGWLICNGQAVSRATYSDLFDVIDVTYGIGDGSSTFNVPNLGGRVPVGQIGTGITIAVGDTGGEAEHTLTEAELAFHEHLVPIFGGAGSSLGVLASASVLSPGVQYTATGAGGGGSHNNMQPYLGVCYLIKT